MAQKSPGVPGKIKSGAVDDYVCLAAAVAFGFAETDDAIF